MLYDDQGRPVNVEDFLTQHQAAQDAQAKVKAAPDPTAEPPGWFQPGSKSEAALRGFSNAATLGAGKYLQAPINAAISGDPNKSYWENIKSSIGGEVGANQAANEAHPIAYGAGAVAAGLPMGALGATKSLGTQALASGAANAVQTGLDTQDPMEALKAGVVGAALPVGLAGLKAVPGVASKAVDAVANFAEAPTGAAEKVGKMVGQMGRSNNVITQRAAKAGVDTAALKGKSAIDLGTKVEAKGLAALDEPQWASLKTFITQQTPKPSLGSIAQQGYKEIGLGSAAGAYTGGLVGMPVLGAATGGVLGAASAAKKALVNREIHKQLSPAAQAGAKQIDSALKQSMDKVGAAGNQSARWASVTGYLNQTSPEARAALNSENPLNEEEK